MKGLLKKDLYSALNYRFTLLILGGIGLVNTIFSKDGGNILCSLISMAFMMSSLTPFSYDESAQWDKYAVTLPVSRKQIVASRYLYLLLSSCAGLIVSIAIRLFFFFTTPNINLTFSIAVSTAVILFFLISYCLSFPLIYKLGIEKARFFTIVTYMIPLVAVIGLLAAVDNIQALLFAPGTLLLLLFAGVVFTAICFIVSYYISVAIYNKKEF